MTGTIVDVFAMVVKTVTSEFTWIGSAHVFRAPTRARPFDLAAQVLDSVGHAPVQPVEGDLRHIAAAEPVGSPDFEAGGRVRRVGSQRRCSDNAEEKNGDELYGV